MKSENKQLAISGLYIFVQVFFYRFPSFSKVDIFKKGGKSCNLLEPEYFIFFHAQMLRDPGIGTSKLVQFFKPYKRLYW